MRQSVIRDGYGLLCLTGTGDDWNQDGTNGTVLDNMITADYVHLRSNHDSVGNGSIGADNHLDRTVVNAVDNGSNHADRRRKTSSMGRILRKTMKRRRLR